MTTMQIDRAVVEQALEALEDFHFAARFDKPLAQYAIDALHAALAQQDEPVEPVATLIAQRDALLEALKEVLAWGTDQNYVRAKAACDKARAAIKAVEEGR